jgi:hypothetical protein
MPMYNKMLHEVQCTGSNLNNQNLNTNIQGNQSYSTSNNLNMNETLNQNLNQSSSFRPNTNSNINMNQNLNTNYSNMDFNTMPSNNFSRTSSQQELVRCDLCSLSFPRNQIQSHKLSHQYANNSYSRASSNINYGSSSNLRNQSSNVSISKFILIMQLMVE